MPAYPFAPLLTLEQFADKLTHEFGCTFNRSGPDLKREGGESLPIVYIERVVEGIRLHAVIHVRNGDFVQFSVMRSVCAQLKVDPAAFGLNLG